MKNLPRLVTGFAEFLPLLAFVYAGRFEAELSERFFWGAGAVIAIVPILAFFRVRLNPLLVAVNIWLCIEAFAFLVYIPVLATVLQALRESAFFLAIIVFGTGYTVFSKQGMLTVGHADRRQVLTCSIALLALSLGGLAVSVAFRGNELLAATLPATVLFLAQMFMNTHLRDRSGTKSV